MEYEYWWDITVVMALDHAKSSLQKIGDPLNCLRSWLEQAGWVLIKAAGSRSNMSRLEKSFTGKTDPEGFITRPSFQHFIFIIPNIWFCILAFLRHRICKAARFAIYFVNRTSRYICYLPHLPIDKIIRFGRDYICWKPPWARRLTCWNLIIGISKDFRVPGLSPITWTLRFNSMRCFFQRSSQILAQTSHFP